MNSSYLASLLVFSSSVWPRSTQSLQHQSDIDFDLSKSLKALCDDMIEKCHKSKRVVLQRLLKSNIMGGLN